AGGFAFVAGGGVEAGPCASAEEASNRIAAAPATTARPDRFAKFVIARLSNDSRFARRNGTDCPFLSYRNAAGGVRQGKRGRIYRIAHRGKRCRPVFIRPAQSGIFQRQRPRPRAGTR